MFKRFVKEESGQSLVMAALALVALLGMAALVIDVGYMQFQRRSLQNAADAASLAAVMAITEDSTEFDPEIIGIAHDVVEKHMNRSDLVESVVIDLENETVMVSVRQPAPKFFAGVLTRENYSVPAASTAQAVYSGSRVVWNGTALPFVNTMPLTTYGDPDNPDMFVVPQKVNPGNFMNLALSNQGAYVYGTNPPSYNIVFTHIVNKEGEVDGIMAGNGNFTNTFDKNLEAFLTYYVVERNINRFYMFSLIEDTQVGNKEIIPLDKLVLLEIDIELIWNNKKMAGMEVTLVNAYDLVKVNSGEIVLENMNPTLIPEEKLTGARIIK